MLILLNTFTKMKHIYDKHKHWIEIVKRFGEETYAEDIVQEAYIKVYGKDINEAYFYFTLRSLTMDLHRKKVIKVEIDEDILNIPDDYVNKLEEVEPYMNLINDWTWYDKKLFLLYLNNDFSIRELSRETGINFSSVYNTLNNCKDKLKQWQKQEEKYRRG